MTRTPDELEQALLQEESSFARIRAVLAKAAESIPGLGTLLAAYSAAGDVAKRAELQATLALVYDVLSRRLEELALRLESLESLDRDTAAQLAGAVAAEPRLQEQGITVVLDSYLGLVAIMNLPDKHVPPERILPDLIDAYVDVAYSRDDRARIVTAANRVRASMGDLGANHEQRLAIGALRSDSAEAFWNDAFERARRMGSRMVASLLLARDTSGFPARGKAAYRALMDFLRQDEDPRTVRRD